MTALTARGIPTQRLTEQATVQIFERLGAYRQNGHFAYAGDDHGSEYLDQERVLDNVEAADLLACEMVGRYLGLADAPVPDAVAGPAESGDWWASLVADVFNRMQPVGGKTVIALSVGKTGDGGFALSPEDAEQVRGLKVLLIDGIVNSGKSLRAAMRAVQEGDGIIVSASAIWNRGGARIEGVPFQVLVKRTLLRYERKACPFCRSRIPLETDLGHGGRASPAADRPSPS